MTKLAVAIDTEKRDEVFAWAEKLKNLPVVLKLGLRNLPLLSAADLNQLKSEGFELFIDMKLHDIPSTVKSAVTTWAGLGADYLTLHLSGGPQMLSEASLVKGPRLLGVSVLTSLSKEDLIFTGVNSTVYHQVQNLVGLGLHSGIDSFVCSLDEVLLLRKMIEEKSLRPGFFVCPGLVMAGENPHSDQKRTATVEEAISVGVNMMVIGRSIINDPNPRVKTEKILKLIEQSK